MHWHWVSVHYQGRTRARFILRSLLFFGSLTLIRLSGTRMVMTVHNLVPHDTDFRRLHRLVNRLCGRLMDRLIVHNQASLEPVEESFRPRKSIEVIEHIDYEDVSDRQLTPDNPKPIYDVAFFGHVRPYKRLELLIEAIKMSPEEWSLLVLGQAASQSYGEDIASQVSSCERIRFINRFLSDDELKHHLQTTKVVVFPYAESLCSGAAHMALGRGLVPVAPRTTAFVEMIELGLAIEIASPVSGVTIREAIYQALSVDMEGWRKKQSEYLARCALPTVGAKLKKLYASVLSDGHHQSNI